jgi:DNA-binding NarL/FixJ family response regulator
MSAEPGWAALAEGRWAEARDVFAAVLEDGEDPRLLEGLGTAARWLLDEEGAVAAHERAYRLYRRAGDHLGAGRMALQLSFDAYNFRSDIAVAMGWLERARRLVDEVGAPTREAGWIAALYAHKALLIDHDLAEALRRADEAAALAHAVGDVDVQMLSLSLRGLALVSMGRVAEGMGMLDEAGAVTLAGEVEDVDAIQTIYCYLIYGCKRVRDYERASVWCDQVRRSSERWSDQITFAICRAHYADILLWRGAWADCEAELDSAAREYRAINERRVADAVARLGELRRRQGRREEAERLFRDSESHPLSALGRAALAVEAGDPAAAVELTDRYLRRIDPEERTERVAGLDLMVRARVALGDIAGARQASAELAAAAAALGSDAVLAVSAAAEGLLAGGCGDHEAARRALEDAVDLFDRVGAPYEAAVARRDLAGALRAAGREVGAREEERAAEAILMRLASPAVPPAGSAGTSGGLTAREREVLALIARGLSNQEIARELTLSVRTVERHISNIYDKIGAAGRSARAAAATSAAGVDLQ